MTRKFPVLQQFGFKSRGNPGGRWRVTVWPHSEKPGHYCFSIVIAGGTVTAPDGTLRHGCYESPLEALMVGIQEVQSL